MRTAALASFIRSLEGFSSRALTSDFRHCRRKSVLRGSVPTGQTSANLFIISEIILRRDATIPKILLRVLVPWLPRLDEECSAHLS